jgi:o-succinylbenzoate synthase
MSTLRLELRPIRLRLTAPLVTAHGPMHERYGVLVTASDGTCRGCGEAAPLPAFGTEDPVSARAALTELATRLSGAPAPESLADIAALLGDMEATPAARAAAETAFLDLLARRHGISVARLLEPNADSEVVVSALLAGPDPAAAATSAVAEGFGTVKLKVAAASLKRDLDRVRRVRAAIGPQVKLRLDANGGWTSANAAPALGALMSADIELCEQPLPPGRPERWPALARFCRLAADESCADAGEVGTLLDGGALHALVLKPAVLGGLTRALALATRARRAGVESIVTTALEGAVGRAAAAHLAAAVRSPLAHGLATGGLLASDVCADPLAPRGGRIVLAAVPGLGVEP